MLPPVTITPTPLAGDAQLLASSPATPYGAARLGGLVDVFVIHPVPRDLEGVGPGGRECWLSAMVSGTSIVRRRPAAEQSLDHTACSGFLRRRSDRLVVTAACTASPLTF